MPITVLHYAAVLYDLAAVGRLTIRGGQVRRQALRAIEGITGYRSFVTIFLA